MALTNPTVFDAFANSYDGTFTYSTLGQLLRPRVWDKLAQHFTAEQHVLELACGTGEDALWLAQRGIHVTATDGSAEMIRVARAKAEEAKRREGEEAGRRGSVEFEQVSLQKIAEGYFEQKNGVETSGENEGLFSAKASTAVQKFGSQPSAVGGHFGGHFDGAFSNFGGLNTIGAWRPLAAALAEIVKPQGKVILVPMGPVCPWEILWYLVHGQPNIAFRRWAQAGAPTKIGDSVIPIWYPSERKLRTDFAPWFTHIETASLELWLPPSYLAHFVNRWPNFFTRLNQFEKATACLTGGWGDHYIIIFERLNN